MKKTNPVSLWFSKRRFGLFIHFGLYAIEGWHEQDQMRRRIPRSEYGNLLHQFNPVNFNADKILDLAESVGMEYVCLTTKHHDGFCLWDTAETSFNVMNSPYRQDIVKQLADACHRRNFPLGLYYSVVDWHHPNYPNQGRHHELPGPIQGDQPDWSKYVDFLKRQVRELCTNYGEVRHFFWDMNVPQYQDPEINAMIRKLQPTIVINDRGFDQGDFGTPEREYNKSATDRQIRFDRFTEACNSVGTQSWGFRKNEDYYSSVFLMNSIDSIMAKGGNYLLNIGPDSTGNIPEHDIQILSTIGIWYKKTKEAFADTVPATGLTSNKDILLTRQDNTLYVHIPVPAKADAVLIPPISRTPQKAVLLNNGLELTTSTEILPSFWESNSHILAVCGLPEKMLAAGEPLIIRLEFDDSSAFGKADRIRHFEG